MPDITTKKSVLRKRFKRLTAIDLLRLVGEASDEVKETTYLVGGAVRDTLIGKKNKDLDFVSSNSKKVTNRIADKVEKMTGERPTIAVFKFFTRQMRVFGTELEFVDPRKESYSFASIKPEVEKGEFIDDVLRRDFTLNALALGIQKKNFMKVIDLTKTGKEDLEDGVLRTPLDPDTTFRDDPNRLLRLARFSACKGFKISPKTFNSAKRNSNQIHRVPVELIKKELDKGLLCNNYVAILDKLNLLEELFPEIQYLKLLKSGTGIKEFAHVLQVINKLPKNKIMRWVGLLHDLGGVHQPEAHAPEGERISMAIMRRYNFSNYEKYRISNLIGRHKIISKLVKKPRIYEKDVRRFIIENEPFIDDLFVFSIVDKMSHWEKERQKKKVQRILRFQKRVNKTRKKIIKGKKFKLEITGNDIMKALNIPAGKQIGIILKDLKEQFILGKVENKRADLLRFAKQKYKK